MAKCDAPIWGTLDAMVTAPRDPNMLHRDKAANWESEFGFGEGRFPNPLLDYSEGGSKSRIQIADPDRNQQLRDLAALRRTDLSDTTAELDPYVAGNTERYGAQPPLVRETRTPKVVRREPSKPPRMEREW